MRDHSFSHLNTTTSPHYKDEREQTEKIVLLIRNYLSHNLPKPLFKIGYQTHNLFSRKQADKSSNCNIWKQYSILITAFLFNHKKVQVPNLLQIAINKNWLISKLSFQILVKPYNCLWQIRHTNEILPTSPHLVRQMPNRKRLEKNEHGK